MYVHVQGIIPHILFYFTHKVPPISIHTHTIPHISPSCFAFCVCFDLVELVKGVKVEIITHLQSLHVLSAHPFRLHLATSTPHRRHLPTSFPKQIPVFWAFLLEPVPFFLFSFPGTFQVPVPVSKLKQYLPCSKIYYYPPPPTQYFTYPIFQ